MTLASGRRPRDRALYAGLRNTIEILPYWQDFFGIGATIRIGGEMFCLPYAGFLLEKYYLKKKVLKKFLTYFEAQWVTIYKLLKIFSPNRPLGRFG